MGDRGPAMIAPSGGLHDLDPGGRKGRPYQVASSSFGPRKKGLKA